MEQQPQRVTWVIAWGVLAAASVGIFLVWYAGGVSLKGRPTGGTPPPREPLAHLNIPANLENSAVATRLEKFSFHSNPKERQCQRMLKLPHNCTHLIH